jgi:flagellar biosynthesis/type III secretory pathway protein FliH
MIDGEVFDARVEARRIREEARAEGHAEGVAAAVAAAEPEIIRLAVQIAEKILARQLTLTPDAVADVVRSALQKVRARKSIVVRVHPEDVALVTGLPATVKVRADEGVARGGCVVETELGTLDARLASQLAAIERALVDA